MNFSELPTSLRRILAVALLLVAAIGAGAVTIWFNITRVPAPVRPVTAIPPLASIAATILIAYLVKILAVALGRPLTYVPPPPTTGILAPTPLQAPLAGQLTRLPDGTAGLPEVVASQYAPGGPGYGPGPYGPPGAFGQMPTWAPSQIPQTGRPVGGGNGGVDQPEATKRRQVEAYLASLPADQLGRLAGLGPKAAARELTPTLNGQGLQVSERYVQQIWDQWAAARRQAATPRKRKH